MRIEVWEPPKPVTSENVLRPKLFQTLDGAELWLVREDGGCITGGLIVTLTHDGRLQLHGGISHALGLQLGGKGHIKVDWGD